MTRVVYPGTFNPPTIGHLAIVEAVLESLAPARLDLALSRRPLLKEAIERPTFEERLEVVAASFAHLEVVHVVPTDHRLLVDIAAGYDAVVMGADKWHQVHDVAFYGSVAARDDAVARLPRVLVVGRDDDPGPAGARLPVDPAVSTVSSTRARHGEVALMTPAARAFQERTGAWRASG
jgi:hypothetical protein